MKNDCSIFHVAALVILPAFLAQDVFGADRLAPAITPEQVEADWLRQDVVRRMPLEAMTAARCAAPAARRNHAHSPTNPWNRAGKVPVPPD